MATSTNETAPVWLAVIGAGVIGKKHLATIAATPGAKIVAIADPAPAAEATAAEYGIPYFQDTGAMLAATRPDGVIVATPTEVHLPPTLAALDAGAHVLVEKPIAASQAEAAEIVARAKAAGRHVLVGHHRRYYPVLRRTREILEGGEIGDVVTVHGHWTVLKEGRGYWDPEWRKRRAAGPVLTNLIHEFDTLRFVCGEIASVQAAMTNRVRGWDKEDAAAIVITFASGAIGTFTLSDASASPWGWELATGENPAFPPTWQNTHRFTGTTGALEFPDLAIWRNVGGRGWNHAMERQPVPFGQAEAYALQCAHFCDVVRGMAAPLVDAADGTRTLAATVAVFRAAETGERVDL